MPKSKLNLKLLRKVRDRIAEIPESYDQNVYVRDDPRSPCGAAACLAGETIIANAATVKSGIKSLYYYESGASSDFAYDRARKLLRIPKDEASLMFRSGAKGWPQPYRRQFQQARSSNVRARVAVAYLTECLERKAVTW